MFVATTLINGRPGRLFIKADGQLLVSTPGPLTDAQGFTSLEGVTFDAGD